MTLSEFASLLEETDLPLTYRAFTVGEAPACPYLVYYEDETTVQGADNTAHYQIKSVTVELVFDRKDPAIEEQLEELWRRHKLFFDPQEEIYIDTERLHIKSYSVYLY